MTKFSVDIQETKEYTYQVEAETADEAEQRAVEMWQNDETPDHEEAFAVFRLVRTWSFDAQVTNCEEITDG